MRISDWSSTCALPISERAAFDALRERLGDDARVFYRLRDDNHERKTGNISDWVRRLGGPYPQFLILDADSLMTGDTIVRLAVPMDGHHAVPLIQTLPVIVHANTRARRMPPVPPPVTGPRRAPGTTRGPGGGGH